MDRGPSRSRRCWRCRRSTSTSSARACARRPASSSRPARRARCTTSRCSPATAPRRSIPTSRCRRWPACAELPGELTPAKAIANYIKAVGKGLSKIMSKMGVSTYMSYCGAQLFEAIGLDRPLVEKYFRGTASQVGGIGVFEVAEEAIRMHRAAFGADPAARRAAGRRRRIRLDRARRGAHVDARRDRQAAAQRARARTRRALRDVQGVRADHQRPVAPPHDAARPVRVPSSGQGGAVATTVESAAEIVKRFATGAMSLGSISTEAHATLAVAMNRIGGKSNTGEGGGDPALPQRAEGHPDRRRHQDRRR